MDLVFKHALQLDGAGWVGWVGGMEDTSYFTFRVIEWESCPSAKVVDLRALDSKVGGCVCESCEVICKCYFWCGAFVSELICSQALVLVPSSPHMEPSDERFNEDDEEER